MKTLRLFLLAIVSAAAAAWGWRRVDVGAGTLPAPGAAAPAGIAVSAAAAEKAELEEALKGLPDGPLADWARRIAAAQATDFPRLREEIEQLAREDQDEIRSLLMARWAEVDPAAAWAASGGWDLRSLVLAVWLQRDFSAAAAALETLGENATRELELAANRLLDDDPETFWRIATARRCTPVWGDPRWEALVRSHEDEAAALAREVIGGRKKTDSRYAPWGTLKIVHQAEAERDPLGAMQRAQALPENERKLALCVVLPFAAKADLEAATAVVLTLRSLENCPSPGAPGIPQVLSAIAQDLGRRDPGAALEWLRRVDPGGSNLGDAQGQVLAAAMREGRLSPQEAFGLVCAGAKDPEAAWSTASDETWRGLPAATLGDAAAWLRDRTQDSTAASDALRGVLQAWSRVDRQGAIAFAAGLPSEKQAPLLRAMLFPRVDSADLQRHTDAAFPAFGSENGAPVSPIHDEMPL